MTDPVSQITIYDGTSTVNVDGYATAELTESFNRVPGGSTVTRFLDGSAIKQTHWTEDKWRIQIQGRGWVPSGLWALDYTVEQTWTIITPSGTAQYTVFADLPDESWNVNAASTDWTLTGEET